METVIVTGSGGLVGAASVKKFAVLGFRVIGIDNDMRSYFFGKESSTSWAVEELKEKYRNYLHYSIDIRDADAINEVFKEHNSDIRLVIHTAAQPSHDWAAKEPRTDFEVNSNGTLNVLESVRIHAPRAVFIHCSTNKVYGDRPNFLPLIEEDTRWEVHKLHPYAEYGIDEEMSVDQCKHSIFGVSKTAADLMVQEYGRYFGLMTVVFRGGCLTGPGHSGAQLHGFLAYLMKCAITSTKYTIFGYKGKQVRDNIHSTDLVNCFYEFFKAPRSGEVYNIGGSRHSNCSVLEAITLCEEVSGKRFNYDYSDINREGDHIWYISDVRKFQTHYPSWNYLYSLRGTLQEIHEDLVQRLRVKPRSQPIYYYPAVEE